MQNLKEVLGQDEIENLEQQDPLQKSTTEIDNRDYDQSVRGLAVVRTRALVGVQGSSATGIGRGSFGQRLTMFHYCWPSRNGGARES